MTVKSNKPRNAGPAKAREAPARPGADASDYTPGGNWTQTFVDLLDAGNAQAQLIMKAIAQHADWKTGACHPSVATLFEIAKCSDKTMRRYLTQLKGDGLIEIEPRFAEGEGENGRRTSNKITLVGYAEWAAANRTGGVVKAPRKLTPYDDPPPGQSDQGGTGQPDQGPLVNLTRGPGQPERPGALVNKVTSTNELDSNLRSNTPPLPPVRKRSRRAREREEIDLLIEALRGRSGCSQAVDLLLAPILRQRKFDAPDPAHTLGVIADWAKDFPIPVLEGALHRLLEHRDRLVEEQHITAAVRAAVERTGEHAPIARPGAKPQSDGFVTITLREQPEAYTAWLRFHQGLQVARKPNRLAMLTQHEFTREATLFPPGIHAIDGGAR